MKENVLITGGFGNLGSWMLEYLLNKNYQVYVLTRKYIETIYDAEVIEADISNPESLTVLNNFNFDHVIHLASYNEFFDDNYFEKALAVNTFGTYNLIQNLKAKKIKSFIYFSTYHVYGDKGGFFDEKSEVNPSNDYAQTHYFAEKIVEQYCTQFHFPYTIFRLSNSYGCPKLSNNNKWYLALNDFCKQAFFNNEIVLKTNGELQRDFIWMEDVCAITETFIQNDYSTNEIYNLSSLESIKILELANLVVAIFQIKFNRVAKLIVNEKDLTNYKTIELSNLKLKQKLNFRFSNRISFEIENILNFLMAK